MLVSQHVFSFQSIPYKEVLLEFLGEETEIADNENTTDEESKDKPHAYHILTMMEEYGRNLGVTFSEEQPSEEQVIVVFRQAVFA